MSRNFSQSIAAFCLFSLCLFSLLFVSFLAPAYANNFDSATLASLEQKLGVRELERPSGRSMNLKVKVSGRRDCYFGDLDAIFLDQIYGLQSDKKTSASRLILSLEPITFGDPWIKPQIHELTRRGKEVSENGFDVTFVVPQTKEPRLLALTICRDSGKHATGCMTKEVKPIEEVLKSYSILNPKEISAEIANLPKSVSDKVYFFKLLVVNNSNVRFPERSNANLLNEWLSGLSNDSPMSQGVSPKEVEQALKIERIISSVPLRNTNGVTTITLPGFDPKKCS